MSPVNILILVRSTMTNIASGQVDLQLTWQYCQVENLEKCSGY